MGEERSLDLVQSWQEAQRPMKDFLEERYLEAHEGGPEVIRRRLEAWERNIRKMEARAAEVPEEAELQEWQASEMLDGVIQELEMDPAEEYRYLLNVFLLSGERLAGQMNGSEQARVRGELRTEYEEEWSRAEAASEADRNSLYVRTVRMMQSAGITYQDNTRAILAQIGAGQEARFPETAWVPEMDREDLCLLACYTASEMLLAEEGPSPAVQDLLVEEAVPVYAAAEALVQSGRDPGTMEKLAQSLLGSVTLGAGSFALTGCVPFFLLAGAAFTAVRVAFTAVSLTAAGAAAALGTAALSRVWKSVSATPHPEVVPPKNVFRPQKTQEKRDPGLALRRQMERLMLNTSGPFWNMPPEEPQSPEEQEDAYE